MAYDESGYIPNVKFEWYLKNNLGSTMLVYGTQSVSQSGMADFGIEKAAYDYRAFGEQMSIVEPADKVTENFTGKELDDEIVLNYFGARYLDPMLGLWTSVDAKRQYPNPYLYAGDNPIMRVDPDGNQDGIQSQVLGMFMNDLKYNTVEAMKQTPGALAETAKEAAPVVASAALMGVVLFAPEPVSKVTAGALLIKDLATSETPGEFVVNFGMSLIPGAKTMGGKVFQNLVKDVAKDPASKAVDQKFDNQLDDMIKNPEDYE